MPGKRNRLDMVIIDCERLKVNNTGIYHFCLNLAGAILEEVSGMDRPDVSIFLRKRNLGILGKDISYTVYRSLYKYIFPYWKLRGGLWHSMFQYPLIMPEKGKVLLTVHDLNFLYEDTPEGKGYWLSKLQQNVDKATEIVAISEFTRQDIMRHVDTADRPVHMIHNGCTFYTGPVKEPETRPEGEFIYTVGAILPKKNFHVLPCLLQDNSMQLIISGPGDGPYRQKILDEARACGVSERVHMTGPVSEEEKQWYLKNCTAFAFPSVAEGFGLPVLEAMYYGKPVFLSPCTSLPEIGADKAFYFEQGFDRRMMKAVFASGMAELHEGTLDRESIRRHAESFSWKKAAAEYVRLYRRLLEKR